MNDCFLSQLRHKAAEVIRQQLETRETPLLYCMLGDATDDLEHYNKALEMTEGRSARAHRALGMHHYFRKEYGQAVEHMKLSMELNSFQGQSSWISQITYQYNITQAQPCHRMLRLRILFFAFLPMNGPGILTFKDIL